MRRLTVPWPWLLLPVFGLALLGSARAATAGVCSINTSPRRQVTQRTLAAQPTQKLLVREEGWYRVTQPELVTAGLDAGVDPSRLQLFVDGCEVPILVTL